MCRLHSAANSTLAIIQQFSSGTATDLTRRDKPYQDVPQYDMKQGRTAEAIVKWLNEQLSG